MVRSPSEPRVHTREARSTLSGADSEISSEIIFLGGARIVKGTSGSLLLSKLISEVHGVK